MGIKGKFKLECKCGYNISVNYCRYKKFEDKEYKCKSCTSKDVWSKKTQEQRDKILNPFHEKSKEWFKNNPERASEIGRSARKSVKMSGKDRIDRQMRTIIESGNYNNYCEKRRQIAKKFHASLSEEDKESHYQKIFANNSKSKSQAEINFFNDLKQVGIHFEQDKCVCGYFPDGVNYNKKIIIEFYGDVYHCNPKKFKDKNKYCSWINRTVEEQWNRDRKRLAIFYKNKYDVIVVWESDWYENKIKELERIKNAVS